MGNSKSQADEVKKMDVVDVVPCEFCSKPFKVEEIVLHQSRCRPDLLHYSAGIETEKQFRVNEGIAQGTVKANYQDTRTIEIDLDSRKNMEGEKDIRYRGTVEIASDEGMVPCEFCSKLCTVDHIALHQLRCRPGLLSYGKKNISAETVVSGGPGTAGSYVLVGNKNPLSQSESGESKNRNTGEPSLPKPSDSKQATLAVTNEHRQENGPKLDLVPCEFCTALFSVENIVLHQSSCRPDLLHGGRKTTSDEAEPAGTSWNTDESVHNPSREMPAASASAAKPHQEEKTIVCSLVACEFCKKHYLVENIALHRSTCKNLLHNDHKISAKPKEIDVAKSNACGTVNNNELKKKVTGAENIGKNVMGPEYYRLSLQPSRQTSDKFSVESKGFEIEWIPASGNTIADMVNFPDERKMEDNYTVDTKTASESGQVENNTEYKDDQLSEASSSTTDYVSVSSDNDSKPSNLNKDGHASSKDVSTMSLSEIRTKDVSASNLEDCPKVSCASGFKQDIPEHEPGCFRHSSSIPELSKWTKHCNCSKSHKGASVKPEGSSTPHASDVDVNCSNDLNSPVNVGLDGLHISQGNRVCGICSNTFDCSIFSEHESICKQKLLSYSSPSISESQLKIDSMKIDEPEDGRKTEEHVVIKGISYELKLNGMYESKLKNFQCSEHIAEQHGAYSGEQCSDSKKVAGDEVPRDRCIEERCSMPSSKETNESADQCEAPIDKCGANESKHMNFDENICLIPCEFCSRSFYEDFIVEHQSGCKPDLSHIFNYKPDSTLDPLGKCSKTVEINVEAQKTCQQEDICRPFAKNSGIVFEKNLERADGELKNVQCSKATFTEVEISECEANRNGAFQAIPIRLTNEPNMKHETMNLAPCKLYSSIFYSNYITEHQSNCGPVPTHCQPETVFDHGNINGDPEKPDVHNVKPKGDADRVINCEANIKETSEDVHRSSASLDQGSLETGYKEKSEIGQHRLSVAVQCSLSELAAMGMQVCPVSVGVQCSGEDLTSPTEVCPVSIGVECSVADFERESASSERESGCGSSLSERESTSSERESERESASSERESASSERESASSERESEFEFKTDCSEISSSAAFFPRMGSTLLALVEKLLTGKQISSVIIVLVIFLVFIFNLLRSIVFLTIFFI